MIIIYRCKACGKWAHNKRQPRSHRRSVLGVFINCGPFERWEAVRL